MMADPFLGSAIIFAARVKTMDTSVVLMRLPNKKERKPYIFQT
jgi:hypothetical protein